MKQQTIISLNPSKNYAAIGEISISTHEEVISKVKAARIAQPAWVALGIKARIALLEKIYQQFVLKKGLIGDLASQEMGMPVSVRDAIDLDSGLQYMRGYLDFAEQWLAPEVIFENDSEIHYMMFEPRGVVGASIPWNYPFCNFIWAIMQNLVVGNTVVFKHSEECSLTGKLLEEIVESVGLPSGVFAQVYGDGASVGEMLMNSAIDLIYFTGSTGVGKHLYQVAAKKFIPAILELGGSAPGIIFSDADIKKAIESVYLYRFVNSGQTCDGLKRLIVHKSCFEEVVSGLSKLVATKKVGDAQDPKTDIGPLVAERQLIGIENQVADAVEKGAKIVCGGKRPAGLLGAYYEPTILTNITCEMKVWKEEVFGPVLPIVSFETQEEAIALANDTQYGLGGYVYSQNKEFAMQVSSKMQTGNVSINGGYYGLAHDPFGGYKNSGLGREHGRAGLRELCTIKTIALKK